MPSQDDHAKQIEGYISKIKGINADVETIVILYKDGSGAIFSEHEIEKLKPISSDGQKPTFVNVCGWPPGKRP